jgi:hypothetical protein
MKLKPCPFCGCEAVVQENEDWPDCVKQPHIYYTVGCHTEGCVCEVDLLCVPFDSINDVELAWNKRT